MNDLADNILIFVLVVDLIMCQTINMMSSRTYQLNENARAIKLIAGCELWVITPPTQPTKTLVLACPRTNAIRLWPILVE